MLNPHSSNARKSFGDANQVIVDAAAATAQNFFLQLPKWLLARLC
jgi:hypothetical protein